MTAQPHRLSAAELTRFAADYAMGRLSAQETEAVESLLAVDPDFAKMVEVWREGIREIGRDAGRSGAPDPFDIPDRNEPDDLRVPRPNEVDPEVLALERMARRWRVAAVIATAATGLAAVVAFGLFVMPPPPPPEPQPTSFVAVLTAPDAQAVGWIASVDPDRQELTLVPQGDALANVDRSLEIWFTPPGGKMRSLGTVDRPVRLPAPPEAIGGGGKLTATIEPPGGAKSDEPTGPVMFEGLLLKVK